MVGPVTPRGKNYPAGPRNIRDIKPTPKPKYRIENIQPIDQPPNYPRYQRSIIQDANFGVVRGKPVDPFNKKQRDARSISPPSPRPQHQNTDVTRIKFPDDFDYRSVRPNRTNRYRRASDPGTPRRIPRNNRRSPPSPRPNNYRRSSDPETPRRVPRNNRRPPPSPRQRSFQSLPDRRLHTGSEASAERDLHQKRDTKNRYRRQYYDDTLPNMPMRQTDPVHFPPRPIFVEKSPEAVAVIPTNQARFTPDMNRIRQKTFAYSETKRNFPVHVYRDPDRLVEGAKYPDGVCCGALNSTFLITIWGFLKILQLICCIIILVCAILEGLDVTGIFWVIFVAALGILVSLGTIIFHLARGHLKESRCVLFTEFTLYLFMSLCVLSAAIVATLNSEFTDTITCITIVGFIATLLFGVDTIIAGSWIGARTYVPPSMRPGPVRYPPNYQPKVYYPRARKEVIYDPPEILLDPWEKKIHYNDYRPSRYNFNLNNPRDARLPDRVDVRYYQNKQPRYLKPLYRREYRFPEERLDYEYDDIRTAPVPRYQPREIMDGFRSFPDNDFRRYQRMVMKPILREDDLLRDDSRTHVTVFHHREYDKRPLPRLYNNYRRRNSRFPEFDDFTSENELDSNMPSRGSNDFSLNPNYHKRRDYRLPNFKNYDDWRIQKHRARQLSTIPAKPRLRREHFWSVDSIPSDKKKRREYPNFKTYEDWNIPRDRFSISSVPNRFPEKDDYQSSFGPFESKVGDNFSTTPFPDKSLVDTSSLIRPYRPKPRRDPDLQEKKSVNSRNDPVPGVAGDKSIVQDRISNRDSDIVSLDANRSTNSRRMQPIFNKEKEPKARKSVGSV